MYVCMYVCMNVCTISDPDNVPAEVLSINEKPTLNVLGRVGFDRRLEGFSVNHKNNYCKVLKFTNKSKLQIYRFQNFKVLIMKIIRNYYANITVNINVLYMLT